MKTLRIGDSGEDVEKWQIFLTGQNLYVGLVDGEFGQGTKNGSIAFQQKHRLQPDGIVGNKTIGVAMTLGLGIIEDDNEDKSSPRWPPRPNFSPLVGNDERGSIFGRFRYRH